MDGLGCVVLFVDVFMSCDMRGVPSKLLPIIHVGVFRSLCYDRAESHLVAQRVL